MMLQTGTHDVIRLTHHPARASHRLLHCSLLLLQVEMLQGLTAIAINVVYCWCNMGCVPLQGVTRRCNATCHCYNTGHMTLQGSTIIVVGEMLDVARVDRGAARDTHDGSMDDTALVRRYAGRCKGRSPIVARGVLDVARVDSIAASGTHNVAMAGTTVARQA